MGKRGVSCLSTVERQRRDLERQAEVLASAREDLATLRQALAKAEERAASAVATERDLDAALERLGRVSRERDELRATLDAVAAMVRR